MFRVHLAGRCSFFLFRDNPNYPDPTVACIEPARLTYRMMKLLLLGLVSTKQLNFMQREVVTVSL